MSNQTLLCVAKRPYTLFLTQTSLPGNSPCGFFSDRERCMKATIRSALQVLLRRSAEGFSQGLSRVQTQGTENSAGGAATEHQGYHPPQLLHTTVIDDSPSFAFFSEPNSNMNSIASCFENQDLWIYLHNPI